MGGKYLGLTDTSLIYLHDLMSVFIVSVLFLLFSKIERYHVRNKLVSLVGRSTLEIYVLQYYLLYATWLVIPSKVEMEPWVDFVASPVYAIVICALCVGISKGLHRLKLGWVFGR